MKRFKWPLQRLLDVTVQREQGLRAELLALSRQMARARQEIFRRQAVLRSLLGELARQELPQRIPKQQLFLKCSAAGERDIRRLREELKRLESQRREKTEQFLKTRASRETLERRRAEARQRHIRQQLKIEQTQFDEGAHVSYARQAQAAAGGPGGDREVSTGHPGSTG